MKTINFGTELDLEATIRINNNQSLEEIIFDKLKNVVSGDITIHNNEALKSVRFNSLVSSNFVKDKNEWMEPYIFIYLNTLLEEINMPSLENFYKISIENNESLPEIIFPELLTVHKNLTIQNNINLSKYSCQN